MKLSVPTALAERGVKADAEALSRWASVEAGPVVRQLRDYANQTTRERAELTTAGTGALELLWESEELPTDGTWTVGVEVTAAGAAYASIAVVALVRSVGGAVSLIGSTTLWQHFSVGLSVAVTVNATARTVSVSINDGTLGVLKVVGLVEVTEAVP